MATDWSQLALALQLLGQAPASGFPNSGEQQLNNAALQATSTHMANQAVEEQRKKEEKEAKKQKLGETAGSLIGAAAGTLIPGVGNLAGAALGAGLGGQVGSAVTGGGGVSGQQGGVDTADLILALGDMRQQQRQKSQVQQQQPMQQGIPPMIAAPAVASGLGQLSQGQQFLQSPVTTALNPNYVLQNPYPYPGV